MIQETVDRPGWESGNAFALLMQPAGGRFRFRQWDYGEGEYAARLHVECSLAATATPTATPTPEVREVTIEYEYDPLNRLTTADFSTGEYFHFTYDPVGNRLTQDSHYDQSVYTYDAANRLVEVDSVAYTWSANGELLDDGERAYTYDHAGRLSSLVVGQQSYTFSYNGLGDRLSQSLNGEAVQYTLDLNAGLTQVLSDKENSYLYGLSRIGQFGSEGWAYNLPDALGSVRQMADPAAAATFAQSYEPYGNVLDVSGASRTPYGFAGEWMDRTGLVHLRARYYAPYFGTFVQPDPFSGYSARPQTQNPYVYAFNNPVLLRDPTGHNPAAAVAMAALVGAGVGFGVGVTIGGAYGYTTYPWALSGECGCDARQRALQMTRWEWAGAYALAGGVVGGVAGGIASIGPIGLIAVGGVGVVFSGADIIHTVDIIRTETGGMTWCLGTR